MNSYADIDIDLSELLHGIARLHVALGRMDETGITTRGWSYNQLVSGVVKLLDIDDPAICQDRAIRVLFDTLEGVIEIGARAVIYLEELSRIC